MAFTAKDVMELREKSGAGMLECKKALVDADGDISIEEVVATADEIPAEAEEE